MSFKRFSGTTLTVGDARPALLAFVLVLLAASASAQTDPAPSPGEAESLNARVVKLAGEGKYEEALPLVRRVLELRRKEGGGDEHPSVAGAHMNLAVIQQGRNDYDGAQSSYKRALAIYEKRGDEYAAQAARALDALARLARSNADAVSLHERSL